MRMFDVQAIEITAPRRKVFEFLREAANLPRWAHAFVSAGNGRARLEEVKIGCTLGMLQCLDRPHRLAYVLGEILDLSGPESAEALGISAELFRKRLQHARTAIETFTRAHCGLASDSAACACHRRVAAALRLGRVRPDALDFAGQPSSYQEIRELVRRAEHARWALQVHRASRPRTSAVDFARRIAQSFDSSQDR
jgi:hypothetical protein